MSADNSWRTKGKNSTSSTLVGGHEDGKVPQAATGDQPARVPGNKPSALTISLSSAREAQRMVLDGARYPGGSRDNPGSALYVGTQPAEELNDPTGTSYKLGGSRKPGVDGVNSGSVGTGWGAKNVNSGSSSSASVGVNNSSLTDSTGANKVTGISGNKNSALVNTSKNKAAWNVSETGSATSAVSNVTVTSSETSETSLGGGDTEEGGVGNPLSPGRTKGLAGFWSNQNDEVKAVKKKRFVAESSTMFDGADPTLPCTSVVENTPLRPVEGMIRAEDPGEWQKPIEVEDGRARNLANSFQMRRPTEQPVAQPRKQILLNTTPGAEEDNSNGEASSLQGKVKVRDFSDKLGRDSRQDPPKPGPKERTFADRASFGGTSAADRTSFGGTTVDKAGFGGTAGDRASFGGNVSDRVSTGGNERISFGGPTAIVLSENEPELGNADVIKSEVQAKDEPVFEAGRTKNLMQLWKNTEVEYNAPKTSTSRFDVGAKPSWIAEIEEAKGITVDIVATSPPGPATGSSVQYQEEEAGTWTSNRTSATATETRDLQPRDLQTRGNSTTFKDNSMTTRQDTSYLDNTTSDTSRGAAPQRFDKSSKVFEGSVKSERDGRSATTMFNCDEYRIVGDNFAGLRVSGLERSERSESERRLQDEWSSTTTTIVPVKTNSQSNSTKYERRDLPMTSSYNTPTVTSSSSARTSSYDTSHESNTAASSSQVTSSIGTSYVESSGVKTVAVEIARHELDSAQDMLMDILNELQSVSQSSNDQVSGGGGGDLWFDSVTAPDTNRLSTVVDGSASFAHSRADSLQTYPTLADQSHAADVSLTPSDAQWSLRVQPNAGGADTTPCLTPTVTDTTNMYPSNEEMSSKAVYDYSFSPSLSPYTPDVTQRDSVISSTSSSLVSAPRPLSHFEDAHEVLQTSTPPGYDEGVSAARDRSPSRPTAKHGGGKDDKQTGNKKSGKTEEKSTCCVM